MTFIDAGREYYTHEPHCIKADLGDVVEMTDSRGNTVPVRYCAGCSGVFHDKSGEGVCVTSSIFDEPKE